MGRRGEVLLTSRIIVAAWLALYSGHVASAQNYQGTEIFEGLKEVALKLLTPEGTSLETTRRRLLEESVKYDPDSSQYFDFFPSYAGIVPLGETVNLDGQCFQNISARSVKNSDTGEVDVIVSLEDPKTWHCSEVMIIATDADFNHHDYTNSGSHKSTFRPPSTPAEIWDLEERGPRVFIFRQTLGEALSNLVATLQLFEPCLIQGVPSGAETANLNFLRDNAGIVMHPRTWGVPEILPLDKKLVRSGDTIDILRLDGLDPMIAWAMGAATGHTAVALWKDELPGVLEPELYLCESNAKSPYWPLNGIQCNPWEKWMEYGRKAGYNAVWVPLNRSRPFNETAAWEFFNAHEGIDYGWEIVLMGLLDSEMGNIICVDAERTRCVTAEHWELIFSLMDSLGIKAAARIFKPAIMQRAGVDFDLPIVEAYHKAFLEKSIEPKLLHYLPEKDEWQYPTLRNGNPFTSDVSICNVFACKVWRAAGVFDGMEQDFACGEFSVSDNYRLNIYEDNFERPEVCSKWDPDNPLCQVLGKYQLRLDSQPGILPRYNYAKTYPGFGNACPAQAPEYIYPEGC